MKKETEKSLFEIIGEGKKLADDFFDSVKNIGFFQSPIVPIEKKEKEKKTKWIVPL